MNDTLSTRSSGPWGPGLTLVFGTLVFLVYSIAQGLALIPMVALHAAGGVSPKALPELATNGFNLAIATAAACPVMLFLCGLLVRARQGPAMHEYLAVLPVRGRVVLAWIVLMAVTGIGLGWVNDLLGREAPEFIAETFATAGYPPFFWAAIAICAPVAEEVLFRGFIYAGLSASRLGWLGAVVVTSLLFTGVHAGQYGWVDLMQVAWIGLLLGIARAKTGSLLTPMAMHITLNMTSLALLELSQESG